MNFYKLVSWRARAYQGSVFGSESPPPRVSEIVGVIDLTSSSSLGGNFDERLVSHVRRAVEAEISSAAVSVTEAAAVLSPFMTVSIEKLNKATDEHSGDWDQVARLDLITDGCVIHAGIWVNELPERLLPTVPALGEDTAWSVFVRLLAPQDDSYADD